MKFDIIPTPSLGKALKALTKRHRSIKQYIEKFSESLQNNPFQGDELSPGIRKIRMAISSKGKGKSGGARIITYTVVFAENNGEVYLQDIYDKTDFSTIDLSVIQKRVAELGL